MLLNTTNLAPVNSVPGVQSTNEDTSLVFSSSNNNSISISDVNVGSNPVAVTLTATNGTLTLGGTNGLTFTTGDDSLDATTTFTGTLSNINAALNNLRFTPTANFNGAASLEVTTNDQGNSSYGKPLIDTDTVNITVNAVNDAPVPTNNSGLTLGERATVTIDNNLLLATDVDNPAAQITYTITDAPDIGTLKLNGGVLTANSTFTQADINLNRLTYTHIPNSPNSETPVSDLFKFTVADSQGSQIPETTFNIGFTPVDDVLNGTTGNDTLYGLRGNDTLNGQAGSDLLNGGTGNDTYVVDNIRDVVTETEPQGIDTVQSTAANYTLSANVEDLTLVGNAAINGTGNTLNNTIAGNDAANILKGGNGFDTLTGAGGNDTLIGGAGNDTLTGGAGADRFIFSAPSQGVDTINDFSVVDDTIDVSGTGFRGGLIKGAAITPEQFVIGQATDSFAQFIYNNNNGALLFDLDGTGSTAPVQIATLSPNLAMTNADIFVIA